MGSRTFWASLWTLFCDFRTINKQKRRVYFLSKTFWVENVLLRPFILLLNASNQKIKLWIYTSQIKMYHISSLHIRSIYTQLDIFADREETKKAWMSQLLSENWDYVHIELKLIPIVVTSILIIIKIFLFFTSKEISETLKQS